jgi:DNA-binding response OmpR family regulator
MAQAMGPSGQRTQGTQGNQGAQGAQAEKDLQAEQSASVTKDRLIIFDDDPYFGALISANARNFGFAPSYFSSLYAMGPFARIKDYDFAIIDVYMDSIRGDELATYIDMFFAEMPVILVSGENLDKVHCQQSWPSSVRAFIHKVEGPQKILSAARGILRRDRWLRHLANNHAPAKTPFSVLNQAMPGGIA